MSAFRFGLYSTEWDEIREFETDVPTRASARPELAAARRRKEGERQETCGNRDRSL
jgi:hypothetical protein